MRPQDLRAHVPQELDIDTLPNAEGEDVAWVTIVPMQMVDLQVNPFPPIPLMTTFAEVNLRTYVSYTEPDGTKRSGTYFFRIDAPTPIADFVARHMFHLPYHYAHVRLRVHEDGRTSFRDRYSPWFRKGGRLRLQYHPNLQQRIEPNPTTNFLNERYAAFSKLNSNKLLRGDVIHDPWTLYEVTFDETENTLWESVGIEVLERPPLAVYSPGVDCVIWHSTDANQP